MLVMKTIGRGLTKLIALTAGISTLSGCVTVRGASFQVINTAAIEAAQAEIKRQVGVYFALAASRRSNPSARVNSWCGTGDIDYDVVSVKVDLATTRDRTTSSKAGLTAPIGAATVGPSVSSSRTVTNSQELVFTEYALADQFQPKDLATPIANPAPAPIADLIEAQRAALVRASQRELHPSPQPCFTNFDPAKPADPASQIIIGLKFASDDAGGLTVTLGPVSLGGGLERKSSFANTVTVSFKQRDLTKDSILAPCPDRPDVPCIFDPVPDRTDDVTTRETRGAAAGGATSPPHPTPPTPGRRPQRRTAHPAPRVAPPPGRPAAAVRTLPALPAAAQAPPPATPAAPPSKVKQCNVNTHQPGVQVVVPCPAAATR